jgi:aspartyl-tRNA(Asn)/glutamyl-tRNA(Gln) amidotransferase subunit B
VSLDDYEIVIGLEVHAQLATQSKIFSWSSTAFGAEPNTQTDPVCLGLPGVLPVLNRGVVDAAVRLGLAVGSKIRQRCRFTRKHYFYPDLPKNIQISQFDEPICDGGTVKFRLHGEVRAVSLTRIHLEEDAGKNIHADATKSLVDYNRAGVPLCEIVSEPDLRSAEEAAEYVRALRTLVRYLGIGDGKHGGGLAPLRRERVAAETRDDRVRHQDRDQEHELVQERARRDRARGQAPGVRAGRRRSRRAGDTPLGRGARRDAVDALEGAGARLPLLPGAGPAARRRRRRGAGGAAQDLARAARDRFARYAGSVGLSPQDAGVLVSEREIAGYYDDAVAAGAPAKRAANWVINEVLAVAGDARRLGDADIPVPPAALAGLVKLVEDGTLSGKLAKDVFGKMWAERRTAADIVAKEGLVQVSDSGELEAACSKVIAAHPTEAANFKANPKLMGFFVGAVMKETGGKANPKAVNEILRKLLA